MANVTLRHGTQANLPTSGMIEEGCLYYCTDTGNIYYGASTTNLILLSRNDFYGTCDTAAGTQTKVVNLVNAEGFKLTTGVVVRVKFTNANTYSATASEPVKLNVNGTGAVAIVAAGTAVQTGTNTTLYGRAGYVNSYVYNGSQWVWQGSSIDNNTTYTNVSLGQGYGTCDTAASTAAKVVSLSGYEKVIGGIIVVKFTNAVPANATLNVNNKGAVSIYWNSVYITANIIQAGDKGIFMLTSANGYTLLTTDRLAKQAITGLSISGQTITYTKADGSTGTLTTQDTTYSDATQSTHGLMSTTDKTKLDGIASGAEVNQNAFSKIAVSGQTTVEADAKTDTLTLVAGSNVTLTTDATNDKVTIAATDTTYTAATAAPGNISLSAGSAGTSTNYARQDHTHKLVVTDTYDGTSGTPISGKGVKDAIDALPEPMIFKGSLGTGGTITSLPTASTDNEGYTYKVITAGTYASQAAKVGDTFISDGSTWVLIPSGDEPSGTVTSVKITATSPIVIDNDAAITTSGTRALSHANSGATAGSYGDSAAQTPAYGATFKVPYVTVNATGHVTAISEHTVKIPASDNTNTHRPIQVNGTQILGDNTTALNLKAGTNVSITNSSGTVTIAATDTNTTYTLSQDSTDGHKLTFTPSSGSATTITIPDNDTKNTAGSTDSSSKLFLIGATTQADNPQTYSQDTAYVGTDGCLYSNGTKVLTAHQDITGKTDKSTLTTKGDIYYASAASTPARLGIGSNGQFLTVSNGVPAWTNNPNTNTERSGEAYCSTAAGTASKTATMPGFALATNQVIILKLDTTSTVASATLNVNSTGAKPIMIGGAATTTSNFVAGYWWAQYDGTNWNLTRIYFTDTNDKVNQSATTTSNWRKIVLGCQNDASAGTAVTAQTNVVFVSPNFEYQPSTGVVRIKSSDADIIRLYRASATAGAFISYFNNNQTTNYWRAGMGSTGVFIFQYNGTEKVSFNTSGNIAAVTFNNYTLAAACAKGVDTSITANTTSTNLPTSAAVEARINAHSGIDKVGTVTSIATSGTGISGGTITSSGTITLDSSAEGNRAANKVVIAKAAGQINSEKWATTSSGTVKATMQYNSTDDSLDFIFA